MANVIDGRRAAAKRYWDDIVTKGRKQYDEAIKKCATQECKDKAATLIGKHYERTPTGGKGKGEWVDGYRGDGKYKPDPNPTWAKSWPISARTRSSTRVAKRSTALTTRTGFRTSPN